MTIALSRVPFVVQCKQENYPARAGICCVTHAMGGLCGRIAWSIALDRLNFKSQEQKGFHFARSNNTSVLAEP